MKRFDTWLEQETRTFHNVDPNRTMSHSDKTLADAGTFIKQRIDVLDDQEDGVESALELLVEMLPHMKNNYDQILAAWKEFRYDLYAKFYEQWWGRRSGPPNPVLYDSLLLRFKNIDKMLAELERVIDNVNIADVKNKFNKFLTLYRRMIPQAMKQIEVMRNNTPRR